MTQQLPLVMLVDDHEAFLNVVEPIVQARGYRVVCCTGPAEALTRMRTERPDVVVTDVMMTGLDSGFSFARQIKQDPQLAGVPVIILTAISSRRGLNFSPRTPKELEAMHADGFLAKPVAPQDLLGMIEAMLSREGRPAAGQGGAGRQDAKQGD
jgi:CheY-like chemotaxis protein